MCRYITFTMNSFQDLVFQELLVIFYYMLDFVNMSRLGLLLVLHLPHRFLDLEGEFSGLLYSPWM